ncbi:MAG: hypothetical protein FWF02_09580 [Micrococcales bacterium]|nr:hypothetical protein [Micrococcales bacterium]MCL2667939.1 hypothetical protein [Micrococcales bacterium]
MSDYSQHQQPQPMPPSMPPQGTGYYPAQAQPQYAQPGPVPTPGPGLTAFPGQLFGLIMVIAGGVLSLLGLILVLAADVYSRSGQKILWLGAAFLIGGLVMVGQWLAAAITIKAKS